MLQSVRDLIMPAALQRATLLVNHVLSAEPAAMQRLVPHSGKRLRVELTQWPALRMRLRLASSVSQSFEKLSLAASASCSACSLRSCARGIAASRVLDSMPRKSGMRRPRP